MSWPSVLPGGVPVAASRRPRDLLLPGTVSRESYDTWPNHHPKLGPSCTVTSGPPSPADASSAQGEACSLDASLLSR